MVLALRPATRDEQEFCERLSFSNMDTFLATRQITWDTKVFADSWARFENLVITADGERIGVLRLLQIASTLEIRDLQVMPSRQSQGVGSWALERAITIAVDRRLSEIRLRVYVENPARDLYLRKGFQTEAVVDGKATMSLAV